MQSWLTLSLVTMLLWASWSILSKLGTGRMTTLGAKVWETIGFTLATIPILMYLGFRVVWDEQGFLYSVLGGADGRVGQLFLLPSVQPRRKGRGSDGIGHNVSRPDGAAGLGHTQRIRYNNAALGVCVCYRGGHVDGRVKAYSVLAGFEKQ